MPSGSVNRWLIPDLRTAASLFGLYDRSIYPIGIEPALGNNLWSAEDDTGVFVQLDFKSNCSACRCAATSASATSRRTVTATGYSYQGGSAVKITAKNDYDTAAVGQPRRRRHGRLPGPHVAASQVMTRGRVSATSRRPRRSASPATTGR